MTFLPIGQWALHPLETRFSDSPALPEKVDGIILLGGSISPTPSMQWNHPHTNIFADRIFTFLSLMNKYPNAKAVFTGGTASLNPDSPTESTYAELLFNQLGIPKERIIFENKSRNTFENVKFTKAIVQPQNNEKWIVVSSAFHLPRTVGIFCQQQWPIIPYPAEFFTLKNYPIFSFQLSEHLRQVSLALHEWIGLSAYYLTGKTDQWFPKQCV